MKIRWTPLIKDGHVGIETSKKVRKQRKPRRPKQMVHIVAKCKYFELDFKRPEKGSQKVIEDLRQRYNELVAKDKRKSEQFTSYRYYTLPSMSSIVDVEAEILASKIPIDYNRTGEAYLNNMDKLVVTVTNLNPKPLKPR